MPRFSIVAADTFYAVSLSLLFRLRLFHLFMPPPRLIMHTIRDSLCFCRFPASLILHIRYRRCCATAGRSTGHAPLAAIIAAYQDEAVNAGHQGTPLIGEAIAAAADERAPEKVSLIKFISSLFTATAATVLTRKLGARALPG